jgi:hypothetical protein
MRSRPTRSRASNCELSVRHRGYGHLQPRKSGRSSQEGPVKRVATKLGAKNGFYLEKRPRPKKPKTANTAMTMMMIQRIDT